MLERGAKIILIRPAPVSGFMGPRSPALPEFDPFWKLVAEADIPVGMHASDSGYQRYMNEWEGVTDEMTPFKGGSGFQAIVVPHESAHHRHGGLAHRARSVLPLPFTAVRPGGERHLAGSGPCCGIWSTPTRWRPGRSTRIPVEVFKRNIYVHPFHEEDPDRLGRIARGRSGPVRLGLPPPRGSGRSTQLRRMSSRPSTTTMWPK